jgi:flagellar hook-basal body complex protein FliE
MLTALPALHNLPDAQRAVEPAFAQPAQAPTIGQSFADALGETAMATIGKLQAAEQASFKGMQGGLETREVVDAVMSAEQSLQAAIAIRDKIVTSYLEISRMQI